jgi:hypothetical protein
MQSPLNAGQDMASGGNGQAGVSLEELAQQLAQQMAQLPPDQQQVALKNIEAQSPELASMVWQLVQQMNAQQPQIGGAVGAAASSVDMRPLPEQKPPRREATIV